MFIRSQRLKGVYYRRLFCIARGLFQYIQGGVLIFGAMWKMDGRWGGVWFFFREERERESYLH